MPHLNVVGDLRGSAAPAAQAGCVCGTHHVSLNDSKPSWPAVSRISKRQVSSSTTVCFRYICKQPAGISRIVLVALDSSRRHARVNRYATQSSWMGAHVFNGRIVPIHEVGLHKHYRQTALAHTTCPAYDELHEAARGLVSYMSTRLRGVSSPGAQGSPLIDEDRRSVTGEGQLH